MVKKALLQLFLYVEVIDSRYWENFHQTISNENADHESLIVLQQSPCDIWFWYPDFHMNVPFRNNTRFLVLNLAILCLPLGFLRVSRIKIPSLRCSEAWLRALLHIIPFKINTESFNNGSTVCMPRLIIVIFILWNLMLQAEFSGSKHKMEFSLFIRDQYFESKGNAAGLGRTLAQPSLNHSGSDLWGEYCSTGLCW